MLNFIKSTVKIKPNNVKNSQKYEIHNNKYLFSFLIYQIDITLEPSNNITYAKIGVQ
jgi:hypothetical protein